jgi:hypothetical protein
MDTPMNPFQVIASLGGMASEGLVKPPVWGQPTGSRKTG